jgi:hypothetical protein
VEDRRIHCGRHADETKVDMALDALERIGLAPGHLLGGDQPGILARDADRPAARGADPADDLLVDRSGQDHLGDLRGLGIGDAQPADKARFDAQPLEHRADLRPAAVHDDRIDAHRLQQHHVLGEVALQFGIAHRVAAIFHDEGRPGIALQIRQCLGERFGLGKQRGIGGVGHGGPIGPVARPRNFQWNTGVAR